MIADGQVSLGPVVFKSNAQKVRKLNPNVVCGFAGNAADGFALVERLESALEKYPAQTLRACISVAKSWRTEKYLRHLEATILVGDKNNLIELDGSGNVVEIDQLVGIGSGGFYAQAAARALLENTDLTAEEIATRAMNIAADMCIYTNHQFVKEIITED